MRLFSVLDRKETIRQHTLLEASAGTGKTFSIENLVVRLLCEEPALPIEKILIVTFTRAATRELKERVRAAIARSMQNLLDPSGEMPDYLLALVEEGKVKECYRRLEEALFAFDEAQIFTIHGFCFRILQEQLLEGGVAPTLGGEDPIPPSELLQTIFDFFRTECRSEWVSVAQMRRLLKGFGGSAERLAEALRRVAGETLPIQSGRHFSLLLDDYLSTMSRFRWNEEQLVELFIRLAPDHKGCCNRAGEIKEELLDTIREEARLLSCEEHSSSTFDCLLGSALQLASLLQPENRKKKPKVEPTGEEQEILHFLQEELLPLVLEGSDPDALFALVASGAQQLLARVSERKEWLSPDKLLEKVATSSRDPRFAGRLRERYSAVIVDEFQDTDPLQWEILERLFLKEQWSGFLYLVGDPKQSIYAFRQADIYTYLRAADQLGSDNRAILGTNYRSTAQLVEALNELLSKRGLFPLPRLGSALDCPPVEPAPGADFEWRDGKGAIHLLAFEGKKGRGSRFPTESMEQTLLYPAMASEIIRLHSENELPLDSFAILVRDRYEASRLSSYLEECGIASYLRRDRLLIDSPVFPALNELLSALLAPRDFSKVKLALGGLFYSWSPERLADEESLEAAIRRFVFLQKSWREKGFSAMAEALLFDKEGIGATLLSRDPTLYQDLVQWREWLEEKERELQGAPEALLDQLQRLNTLDAQEDASLRVTRDMESKAVQIMTIHMSKGLEYEVVFAPGLCRTSGVKERFARTPTGLTPFKRGEEESDRFLEELDAEKMRQFYVAVTRAKKRLYLPVAIAADRKTAPQLGEGSPMELFLEEGLTADGVAQRLEESGAACSLTGQFLRPIDQQPQLRSQRSAPTLTPPLKRVVQQQRLIVQSFSSLARSHHAAPLAFEETEEFTLHSMPPGATTGTLLHHYLEEITFNDPSTFAPIAEKIFVGTPLGSWKEMIIEVTQAIVTTPLSFGSSLSQCDRLIREMPFLAGADNDLLLKGFIDLVVEVEGRLYVIDWKSNWLGSDSSSYDQQTLEAAMNTHDYHLQGAIYAAALERFVTKIEKGSFDERWGGCLYLFLRGMPEGKGVYFFKPEPYKGLEAVEWS